MTDWRGDLDRNPGNLKRDRDNAAMLQEEAETIAEAFINGTVAWVFEEVQEELEERGEHVSTNSFEDYNTYQPKIDFAISRGAPYSFKFEVSVGVDDGLVRPTITMSHVGSDGGSNWGADHGRDVRYATEDEIRETLLDCYLAWKEMHGQYYNGSSIRRLKLASRTAPKSSANFGEQSGMMHRFAYPFDRLPL